MGISRFFAVRFAMACLLVPLSASALASDPDRAFWMTVKAGDFRAPPDSQVGSLTMKAAELLNSTDPAVRDGIGYEAISAWVYRDERLKPTELAALREKLAGMARAGLGEPESDRTFGRSFALLCLSVLAAEDLRKPFMDNESFAALLSLGLESLAREQDLRGFVPGKGWVHATAHAADLLKFLARSPRLSSADSTRIVEQIADRVRTAGHVFVWGEDVRLAAALSSIIARTDAELAPFDTWFARLLADNNRLWSGDLDTGLYVAVRAQLNVLAQLAARLPQGAGSAGVERMRAALNATLRRTE
jgi:uncharacterized protein DUF2785